MAKQLASKILNCFSGALCSVVVLMGTTAYAAADGESAGWVGVMGGLSVPNHDNTTARTILGVNGGAKLGTDMGFGAYYMTSSKDETQVNGTSVPFTYDLYGVMGGYFFEGEAKGVHLGVLLGMSKVSSKLAGVTVSTSPMHWGLVAGYDHMLSDNFSLGGDLTYISINSDSSVSSAGTWSQNGFGTLNFVAAAKFWF